MFSVTKVVNIFLLLACLSFALVSRSGGPPDAHSTDISAHDGPSATNETDVVTTYLPDGRLRYDFYHAGTLELYIQENEDDSVSSYDAHGHEISLDDYDDDDNNDDDAAHLVKRVSKWKFLLKFAKLLAKFGKRALQFFECTSINAAWKCSDDFLDCAATGTPPWNCIEGLICVGEKAWDCR